MIRSRPSILFGWAVLSIALLAETSAVAGAITLFCRALKAQQHQAAAPGTGLANPGTPSLRQVAPLKGEGR